MASVLEMSMAGALQLHHKAVALCGALEQLGVACEPTVGGGVRLLKTGEVLVRECSAWCWPVSDSGVERADLVSMLAGLAGDPFEGLYFRMCQASSSEALAAVLRQDGYAVEVRGEVVLSRLLVWRHAQGGWDAHLRHDLTFRDMIC